MLRQQDAKDLLKYLERRVLFRPLFHDKGQKFECSRAAEEKPVFPWENTESEEHMSEYTVFVGNYTVNDLISLAYYNRDKSVPDGELESQNNAITHLCTFDISSEGKFIENTFKIIPFMFAMGQLIKNISPNQKLDEKVLLEKNKAFSENLENAEKLTFTDFEKLERDVLNAIGLMLSDVKDKNNNLTTVFVFKRDAETQYYSIGEGNVVSEDVLLPEAGYILKTIEKISRDMNSKNFIKMISSIGAKFSPPGMEEFVSSMSPVYNQMGRWPDHDEIDIMQYYVTNTAAEKTDSLYSIAAPAGTDRTGIIKDIAADVIVRKAEFLCQIENPDSIFEEAQYDGKKYYHVPEELKKTELIVLSSNEKKAYEIAADMTHPDGGVKTDFFKAEDRNYGRENDIFYTKAARQLFDYENTWGLPVLYIGDKEFVNSTTNTLYRDIGELQSNYHTKKLNQYFDFISIKELCEAMFRVMSAEKEWTEVTSEFKQLYAELKEYKEKAGEVQASITDIPEYTVARAKKIINEIDQREKILLKRHDEAIKNIAELEEQKDAVDDQADIIFDNMSAREQRFYKMMKSSNCVKYHKLMTQSEKLGKKIEELARIIDETAALKRSSDEKREQFEKRLERAEKWEEEHQHKLEHAKEQYPGTEVYDYNDLEKLYDYMYGIGYESDFKDETEYSASETEKQEEPEKKTEAEKLDIDLNKIAKSPLMTKEYIDKSEKLLFKALQVIKVFLRSSEKAKENVNILLKMVNDGTSEKIPSQVYDELLASFQLMIPVLSLSKNNQKLLLSSAGDGSIGKVIITDAASWNIEEAFVPLIKSDSMIMIGDNKSEKAEKLLPQLLSDMLMQDCKLEDYDFNGDSVFSVICPEENNNAPELLVNRNTESSAFKFINNSYKNKLISTHTDVKSQQYAVEKSCFMDITGKVTDKTGYYVEEQGKVVLALFNNFVSVYGKSFFDLPNTKLCIVSPYKSVVDELKALITTKLISVLPSVKTLTKLGLMDSDKMSKFLYDFKKDNILLMDECDNYTKINEMIIVLGCDRHSYIYNTTGEDIGSFNRVMANVTGRLAVIGSSEVWKNTTVYKYLQDIVDIVKVK